MSALARHALRSVQAEQNARFDEAGRALDFGNIHAEYSLATTEAAVFDLADRARLEMTGADRLRFLHQFCTNEVRQLVPGQFREAFVTSLQGKVLAHIWLFVGEESIWIDTLSSSRELLLKHLLKYRITDNVELLDHTDHWAGFYVHGPDAGERLAPVGIDAASVGLGNHYWANLSIGSVHVARVDWLGSAGWLLTVPVAAAADFWRMLGEHALQPAGTAVFEALRIEACFPIYGRDITEANLAQEVNRTHQAISFTKGCYLGQEPIARIDALGHVNQKLRGIRLAHGPAPEPGAAVYAVGSTEKPIGRVTSAALSPANDRPVALGYLRRNFDQPGAEVVVAVGEQLVPGRLYSTT